MIELCMEFTGFRLIYFMIALLMWSVSLLFSKEYFAQFGDKLPKEIAEELAKLEANLK